MGDELGLVVGDVVGLVEGLVVGEVVGLVEGDVAYRKYNTTFPVKMIDMVCRIFSIHKKNFRFQKILYLVMMLDLSKD